MCPGVSVPGARRGMRLAARRARALATVTPDNGRQGIGRPPLRTDVHGRIPLRLVLPSVQEESYAVDCPRCAVVLPVCVCVCVCVCARALVFLLMWSISWSVPLASCHTSAVVLAVFPLWFTAHAACRRDAFLCTPWSSLKLLQRTGSY
jgi:hypothetical protein